jgi:hypothetical protein
MLVGTVMAIFVHFADRSMLKIHQLVCYQPLRMRTLHASPHPGAVVFTVRLN